MCKWEEKFDGDWIGECGFEISLDGNPEDVSFEFCPYCGERIVVK